MATMKTFLTRRALWTAAVIWCAAGMTGAAGHAVAQGVQAPLAASTASAADAQVPAIVGVLRQLKVISHARAADTFVAAENVRPGDVIEYRATYRNRGKQAVHDLVAKIPVPAGTEYVGGSAKSGAAGVAAKFVAADGTKGAEPLMRAMRVAGGGASRGTMGSAVSQQAIPLSEYRQVQWALGELQPGAAVEVVARVRVFDLPSPPGAAASAASAPAASH